MDLVQKGSLVVSATPELRATVANLKVKVEMQESRLAPKYRETSCAESEGND